MQATTELAPISAFSGVNISTKEAREQEVERMVKAVQDGKMDPLKIRIKAKHMEGMIEDLLAHPDYKKAVLDEAQKHGKTFDLLNAKWQVKETSTKWDYSQCGDSTYTALLAEKAQLDAKIKARERYLQTIPAKGVADPETGEMHYPASKSSTTTVAITLK